MASIAELKNTAQQYLADHRYSEETIDKYRRHWRTAERYYNPEEGKDFGQEQELDLIRAMGLFSENLSEKQKKLLRAVKCLLSISENGSMPPVPKRTRVVLNSSKQNVLNSYVEHLKRKGLAPSTVYEQTGILRRFLAWLPGIDISTMSPSDITGYMNSSSHLAPQTKACVLYAIRAFARWASEKDLCGSATAAAMAVIPGHKHSRLPSAYHVDEVAAAVSVAGIGGMCPKRNRAMILLASVLAMRAGSIRELRLRDIDWHERTISFGPGKTNISMTLPMPDEVTLALADYLKNERPHIEDDHVFVAAQAPYSNFSGTSDTFHRVASNAYISVYSLYHRYSNLRSV